MGYDRHRAIALKAADAQVLLNSALPFVFRTMTSAQVQAVQKVLDAEVVNPEIYKQANDIYRKSVIAQSGDIVNRNQQMVERAYRLNATRIPAGEEDKHVRLDFKKLLRADALLPKTDNPDEAVYLSRVRNILSEKGVWLRFDHQSVRVPGDHGSWMIDPRTFQAWLSLGYGGDPIPTKDGQLTREALLGTTVIGAGYWQNVHQGPVQQALEKEIHRLEQQIEYGVMQHDMLAKIRRDAFPGVTEVSDVLGGADFPARSMWDHPHKLLVKALEMRVGGNVSGCQAYLVFAAIVTRNAARLLAAYIDDSGSGAERAVTVLKVAKTAGEIAEIGLAVTGVAGIVRGTVSVSVGGGAAGAYATLDAGEKRLVTEYLA